MANLITRTYTFTDGTVAYGSQVDSEIANIVNTINSLDQAGTTWTNVRATNIIPLADINIGGHQLTNLGTPSVTGNAAVYPITASQITAGTITTTQIAASTITGSNIAPTTITASNIVASTITTAKLASNSVTNEIDSLTSTSLLRADGTLITSKSITVTGGIVMIFAQCSPRITTTTSATAYMTICRTDTTNALYSSIWSNADTINGHNTVANLSGIYTEAPTAGTYTYEIRVQVTVGALGSPNADNYSLVILEIKR